MNATNMPNSPTKSLQKSSGHTKQSRRGSSSSSAQTASLAAPSQPKKYQLGSSASKPPKEEKVVGHSTPKSKTSVLVPPVTQTLRQSSGHTKAVRRSSTSSSQGRAPRRNSITSSSTTCDIMNAPDASNSTTNSIPRSSGHTKSERHPSSSTGHTKMKRRNSESPYGAANTEFTTDFPAAPLDAASASKFAKEIKTLTETVQALAQKLKRRDKEVRKLQETSKNYYDVTLKLESTEERLVEATMDNKSMEKVVQGLKSNIEELKGAEAATNTPPLSGGTEKKPEKRMIEVEEHRKVRMQRDSAMVKAGEMSMALAECRAETDDLRDQLAAVTEQLEKERNVIEYDLESHSPVGVATRRPSLMSSGGKMGDSLRSLWGNS